MNMEMIVMRYIEENMINISDYYNLKKDYYDRLGLCDLNSKLEKYGLNNAIASVFLRKDITGIDSLETLLYLLMNPQKYTNDIITSAKRRYLGYLLLIYGSSDELYESLGITDQDIDRGTSKAMDSVSGYVIEHNKKTGGISL
jgi:hypothetical protein